jgi:hypothetical protein
MRLAEEGGETCSDQTYDADAETSLVEQIFPVSVLFVPLDSGEQIRKHLQRQRLGTKAAELLEERPPVGTGVNGLAKDRGDEQQASKDDGPGRYGPVRIERVVMDNGEQREDRGIYRNYAKRLDVERVVVARLSFQPRLSALDDEFCGMLGVAHGGEEYQPGRSYSAPRDGLRTVRYGGGGLEVCAEPRADLVTRIARDRNATRVLT